MLTSSVGTFHRRASLTSYCNLNDMLIRLVEETRTQSVASCSNSEFDIF
jgi:hypothetical protein